MKVSSASWFVILGFLFPSCSSLVSDKPFSDAHRKMIDSLPVDKDKGINLYWYYYDGGVFGRSIDDYLAISSCSCRLKADSAFFTSRNILKIEKKADTIQVIISKNEYKLIDSTRVPLKVIVDEKTWRYVK